MKTTNKTLLSINESTSLLNELWPKYLIDELALKGLRKVCIAPGSQSTPLVLAAAKHPLIDCFVHPDERTVGYYAVGYAQATNLPVAIITTSGTAVANLLPPVIEAKYERLPLILLTADRPEELHDQNSNQTIDQCRLFHDYVNWEIDLPCPTADIDKQYIISAGTQAYFQAMRSPRGPVHLNCRFRKPFIGKNEKIARGTPGIKLHRTERVPSRDTMDELIEKLTLIEKGLIIVGKLSNHEEVDSIFSLSQTLQWPILCDPLSNMRDKGRSSLTITNINHMLQVKGLLSSPESVLHFGSGLVSMPLANWLSSASIENYIHIANHPDRIDPMHKVTERIECAPFTFCNELCRQMNKKTPTSWSSHWKEASQKTEESISSYFKLHNKLSEPWAAHYVGQSQNTSLFFATSLPIRYADTFIYPHEPTGAFFGKRGTSGIDGTLSTAIGLCEGLSSSLIAIVGDLSFFCDINALSHLKKHSIPLTIVLFNNHGGGLFHFLPKTEEKEIFETCFAYNHDLNAQSVAKLFSISYTKPTSQEEFIEALAKRNGPHIIEIESNREENHKTYKKISSHVEASLSKQKTSIPRYHKRG